MPTYLDRLTQKLARDWNKVAGEELEIEVIAGTAYAFGSELAVLRLFQYYRYSFKNDESARAAFSKNRNSWFFSLEGVGTEV